VKNKSIKNVSLNLNNSGVNVIITIIVYFPFFLGNFVIKGYRFFMSLESEKKVTELIIVVYLTNQLNTTFSCSTSPLKVPNRLKSLKLT
jgi:hypothetical protein